MVFPSPTFHCVSKDRSQVKTMTCRAILEIREGITEKPSQLCKQWIWTPIFTQIKVQKDPKWAKEIHMPLQSLSL